VFSIVFFFTIPNNFNFRLRFWRPKKMQERYSLFVTVVLFLLAAFFWAWYLSYGFFVVAELFQAFRNQTDGHNIDSVTKIECKRSARLYVIAQDWWNRSEQTDTAWESELNELRGDGCVFPTFAKAEGIGNPTYFLETQLPITAK